MRQENLHKLSLYRKASASNKYISNNLQILIHYWSVDKERTRSGMQPLAKAIWTKPLVKKTRTRINVEDKTIFYSNEELEWKYFNSSGN